MANQIRAGHIQAHVLIISAALIAFQLLAIKLFSLQYWHHFAYLIIAVALAGFGASGTFIFLFSRFLSRHFPTVIYLASLTFIASIYGQLLFLKGTDFNPLLLVWQHRELWHLFFVVLTLFFPFFLGALCIGLSFSLHSGDIHRLYAANLLGSGLGGVLLIGGTFYLKPYDLLFMILSLVLVAVLPLCLNRRLNFLWGIVFLVLVVLHFGLWRGMSLPMSSFKELAQIENQAGTKKEWESFGPYGLITVVDNPSFHYLPDLSLDCPSPLPRQKALFLDGNLVGAITHHQGDSSALGFMQCRTVSLAYALLREPEVLIVGGGGGTEVLNSRYHQARRISVVEMNREIVRLMQGPYSEFSGHIYDPSYITIHLEEARGYLERGGSTFDLVQLGLAAPGAANLAGTQTLSENYLLTREGLRAALTKLKEGGILSISGWLRLPPYDSIKLLASVIEAAEAADLNPSESLLAIRSWQTLTVLVKNGGFTPEEIEKAKGFCRKNFFDLVFYRGIKKEETNVFNKLGNCPLHEAVLALLNKDGRDDFYRRYPFQIRPASDDRPFFSSFFKWQTLGLFLGTDGSLWLPHLDWGYILAWAKVGILILLSLLFILAPLPFLRLGLLTPGVIPTLIYFAALGLAYMFLEMAFLQLFIRFLHEPIFSAALVISSFLIYSGIGSLAADAVRWERGKLVAIAVVFICIWGGLNLLFGKLIYQPLVGFPLGWRMIFCSLLIMPLALPMGVLFPTGLKLLRERREALIPWAWGINGFCSVLGSSLTLLIALSWGLKAVVLLALGLYILAGLVFRSLALGRNPG